MSSMLFRSAHLLVERGGSSGQQSDFLPGGDRYFRSTRRDVHVDVQSAGSTDGRLPSRSSLGADNGSATVDDSAAAGRARQEI